MRIFATVWVGQFFSLIGSNLTGFALGVWVYERTGSATQLSIIFVFVVLPGILISPLAGVLADRWDRQWIMFGGDAAAGLSTLSVAILFTVSQLEVWHIYLATAVLSVAGAFQWLAYSTAIPLIVPKQQLGRANGMVQLSRAVAQVTAPALSGIILTTIQLQGVLIIDFITYLIALVTLVSVRIPRPDMTTTDEATQEPLLRRITYGWSYLATRPGLMGLLIFFAFSNFMLSIVTVLATPLVLSIASIATLGFVTSIGGIGTVVGGLVMAVWGGPRQRIKGVFGFMIIEGIAVLLAGLRPSIPLFAVTAFIFFFAFPLMDGCNQAIWQVKVAPDSQGRVFSARLLVAFSSMPLAYLVAGPLADYVFEPLLAIDGPLANSVGRVIGVGPGRGIGFLFIVTALLHLLTTAVGYFYPRIRFVEQELPDALPEAAVEDQPHEDERSKELL